MGFDSIKCLQKTMETSLNFLPSALLEQRKFYKTHYLPPRISHLIATSSETYPRIVSLVAA
jgi:hypothetical protein